MSNVLSSALGANTLVGRLHETITANEWKLKRLFFKVSKHQNVTTNKKFAVNKVKKETEQEWLCYRNSNNWRLVYGWYPIVRSRSFRRREKNPFSMGSSPVGITRWKLCRRVADPQTGAIFSLTVGGRRCVVKYRPLTRPCRDGVESRYVWSVCRTSVFNLNGGWVFRFSFKTFERRNRSVGGRWITSCGKTHKQL